MGTISQFMLFRRKKESMMSLNILLQRGYAVFLSVAKAILFVGGMSLPIPVMTIIIAQRASFSSAVMRTLLSVCRSPRDSLWLWSTPMCIAAYCVKVATERSCISSRIQNSAFYFPALSCFDVPFCIKRFDILILSNCGITSKRSVFDVLRVVDILELMALGLIVEYICDKLVHQQVMLLLGRIKDLTTFARAQLMKVLKQNNLRIITKPHQFDLQSEIAMTASRIFRFFSIVVLYRTFERLATTSTSRENKSLRMLPLLIEVAQSISRTCASRQDVAPLLRNSLSVGVIINTTITTIFD
eukprot:PhM_4_TR5150/c0_g1_i1/m.23047